MYIIYITRASWYAWIRISAHHVHTRYSQHVEEIDNIHTHTQRECKRMKNRKCGTRDDDVNDGGDDDDDHDDYEKSREWTNEWMGVRERVCVFGTAAQKKNAKAFGGSHELTWMCEASPDRIAQYVNSVCYVCDAREMVLYRKLSYVRTFEFRMCIYILFSFFSIPYLDKLSQ